jgi:hypothetical protein
VPSRSNRKEGCGAGSAVHFVPCHGEHGRGARERRGSTRTPTGTRRDRRSGRPLHNIRGRAGLAYDAIAPRLACRVMANA